jgi:hypothetical protein
MILAHVLRELFRQLRIDRSWGGRVFKMSDPQFPSQVVEKVANHRYVIAAALFATKALTWPPLFSISFGHELPSFVLSPFT